MSVCVCVLQVVLVRVNFGDRPFAYGEGHTHRNAADVQKGDSAEELAAAFEELPFAGEMSDGEEREGEGQGKGEEGEGEQGEKGVVVDLSESGPQTKTMKTAIATVGECPRVSATATELSFLSRLSRLRCGCLTDLPAGQLL